METMRKAPAILPSVVCLQKKTVVAEIEKSVKDHLASTYFPGTWEDIPVKDIVRKTLDSVVQATIDIPRILFFRKRERWTNLSRSLLI